MFVVSGVSLYPGFIMERFYCLLFIHLSLQLRGTFRFIEPGSQRSPLSKWWMFIHDTVLAVPLNETC